MPQQTVKRVESIAERLIKLAQDARACGQSARADEFLLRAWAAYEQAERHAPGRAADEDRALDVR